MDFAHLRKMGVGRAIARKLVRPLLAYGFPSESQRIELYLGEKTYFPGEDIPVFVHSPKRPYTLEIVHFAAEDEVVFRTEKRESIRQETTSCAYEHGAGWEESDRLPTIGFEPGVYAVRGNDGKNTFESIFCLRPARGQEPKVAVLLNTNTWVAYNAWGGASLYAWDLPFNEERLVSDWVSMNRPNPGEDSGESASHRFGGELNLLRWLHSSGIEFTCLTDSDLHHDPEIMGASDVLILNTHPEYWSTAMYDRLEGFLASGGSLLSLAGNVMYWKVDMTEGEIFLDKSRRVSHQGTWREQGRPESEVLGTKYSQAGYGTYAPYEVLREDHWLFEGLGLNKGDLFGFVSVVTQFPGVVGASGWEMDQVDEHSPKSGQVLAKGTNPGGGADIFAYDHPGGGIVVSFGSVSSASAVPHDPAMAGMVMNFLGRVGVSPR